MIQQGFAVEKPSFSVTFEQALELIFAEAAPVGTETVALTDGLWRIAAAELCAELPDPTYDQSLRDGYVIGDGERNSGRGSRSYKIIGEIPAGRCHHFEIGPGEAYRIMTGGMVPVGADRVVQQEDCFCAGTTLEVPEKALNLQTRFIQRRGASIPQASPVIPRGTLLGAREIGLLATTGNQFLEVFRRVSVSFFCSGDELVSIDAAVTSGKKISSNRYLLGALLSSSRAVPVDCGVAQDSPEKIRELLGAISRSNTDLIISTGGMGPGKYDLLEAVFGEAGGEIIYRSVALRPGQSSLFGILAGKLFFGLPGPPFAVGVLFNELILPALRKMQGLLVYQNRDGSALLEHDISAEKNRVFTVREGVLFLRGCTRYVRLANDREQPDCHILLGEGKARYLRGAAVRIHLIAQ